MSLSFGVYTVSEGHRETFLLKVRKLLTKISTQKPRRRTLDNIIKHPRQIVNSIGPDESTTPM